MRQPWVAVVALVTVGLAAGCSADVPQPAGAAGTPGASVAPSPAAVAEPFSFAVTPPSGAKDLPVSTEIGTAVTGGTVTSVTVKAAGGGGVPGAPNADGSAWVPAKPLDYGKQYEATVVATDAAGRAETKTTSFATMKKSGKKTGTGLYLFDDHTYGVAMPVVVEFFPGIREQDRAGVQKRLFVKTEPPQPGTWSWVADGSQAYYRAPDYWQPGTKLSVRIAVGGHPTGDGRYGDQDRSATAKIGRDLRMSVDNATKQMTVTENGSALKTMPVSLGKKSTPSSSGKLVVMEKKEETVFDTTNDEGATDRYRVDIQFAQRLTWKGEYIHSAPWSVGDQGKRNVSHGCVNLSPANARWLFGKTLVGDPVEVKGTERGLAAGNGWTAWDLSWADFAKGSALPVPAELAPRA